LEELVRRGGLEDWKILKLVKGVLGLIGLQGYKVGSTIWLLGQDARDLSDNCSNFYLIFLWKP
jgi:hypothetical protein